MKSLYELPKDMLIKMIMTIEENVRKEYENKSFDLEMKSKIFDKTMEMINSNYNHVYFADYHICESKHCENYSIENENGIHFSTSNIFFCLNCDKCFCELHNTNFRASIEYCDECYLELQ